MEELKKLITEAFVHNINHPGFKTTQNRDSMGSFHPKSVKGDTFAEEHKELSKLHRVRGNDSQSHIVRNSVEHYTGEGSEDINRHLLTVASKKKSFPDFHDTKDHIKVINSHIKDSAPLTREHHVYSGLGSNFNPKAHFEKNGGVIKTSAFTSASIHPQIATAFGNHDYNKDQHILHFHLPAGYSKGAYIAPHSQVKEEKEFLLAPNQKWKLTHHETVDVQNHSKVYDYAQRSYVTKKGTTKRHIWTVVPHEG